jgi:hypothetical protein
MDTDNPNLNNAAHDRKEWWEAKKAEHAARVEKMDAEKRMEANDAFNNFSEEFDAAGDWTESSWDEFKAKVQAWWNEGEVKTDEAI